MILTYLNFKWLERERVENSFAFEKLLQYGSEAFSISQMMMMKGDK